MESPRVFLKRSVLPYVRRRAFVLELALIPLGLLMGRIELFDGLMPVGVALIGALDMAGFHVGFPLAGVIAGALWNLPQGMTAAVACGGYVVIRMLTRLVKKKISRVDKLVLLAIVEVLLLPLFYLESFASLLQGLAGMALTLLLCISFQTGLRAWKSIHIRQRLQEEEQLSLCIFVGALALAAANFSVQALNAGVVLTVCVCIFVAYAKGMPAVACAVVVGGMVLVGGMAHPLLLADVAACTLAAVTCRKMGLRGAAAGFVVCCAVTQQYFGGFSQHVGLANALPAAALMAALPRREALRLRALLDSAAHEERTARDMLERLQARAASDMQNTASTVGQMAGLFPQKVEWEHDVREEHDEVKEAVGHVCADCAYRGACWRNAEEAVGAIEIMLISYEEGMRPRPPEPLESSCQRTAQVAAAAVQAQNAYRKNCIQKYYEVERQTFTHRQLKGIGKVMQTMSADIAKRSWPDETASQLLRKRLEREGVYVQSAIVQRQEKGMRIELMAKQCEQSGAALEELVSRAAERPMRLLRSGSAQRKNIWEFEQAQKFKVVVGAATRPKLGGAVSGDSTGSINLPGGFALFALSDGMGSGAAARGQSAQAIQLLLKLYEIGFERDTALECVNRLLMAEGHADMYATLDALLVNLNTGEAEFIKFGAPPSFVLRDGRVHAVHAEALPVGILDEAAPAINLASLKRNDVVILLTDGALDALKEHATEEILRCVGGANTCDEAAKSLLAAAWSCNAADDITVLVARME